jgi:ketosteroid isomerase-like protein
MKKTILTVTVFIIVQIINAQKTIDGLVQAEKNFAAYSVANGTKDAFLKFLDSAGIIFDNGKAVNGIQTWNQREKRPGILNWSPRYWDVSRSNDFGFTVGPWTYKAGPQDSVSSTGHYVTIWHINKSGEWKFLIDLGVRNNPMLPYAAMNNTVRVDDFDSLPGTLKSMLKKEREFIKETKRQIYRGDERKYWYRINLAYMGLLSRNGRMPAMFTDMILGVMNSMPDKIEYAILGSGISSSGDLGYVYGTTMINGNKDNYLRIWRREYKKWRLALEVLSY